MAPKVRFSLDLMMERVGDLLRFAKGTVFPREIVTLHHLACSGGTIITKCLAAMPSTIVLSEIHPDRAAQPAFHPLNQIMHGYGSVLTPNHLKAVRGHFRREIGLAYGIAHSTARTLIVRDHSHVDFVWRSEARSKLVDALSREFQIRSVVTIRDPKEVWLSLKREGWFDGTPDELCRAHLRMIDAFPNASFFRYEDFTNRPDQVLRQMCQDMHVEYDPNYQLRLKQVTHLTGDSGRSSPIIEPRPQKELPPEDLRRFEESEAYRELLRRLRKFTLEQSDS